MKKILLTMVASCMFFADGCFAVTPPAMGENVPHLKREVWRVYNDGQGEILALKKERDDALAMIPFAVPKDGRLMEQSDQSKALCAQLMMLYSSLAFNGPWNFHNATNAADRINIYDALYDFMGAYSCDTAPAANVQNSLFSHYAAFAAAVGNSDTEAAASFKIIAKNQNEPADARQKSKLVDGMTLEKLKDAASVEAFKNANMALGDIGAQSCLWLGFLALVEMAEKGTLGNANLDGVAAPLGYTKEIMSKIKVILPELR